MKTILGFVFIYAISLQSQWVQVSTVPTSQLNAVKFFDVYTGVTCGVGGVWRSTNSGVNWTQVLVTSVSMNSISFPDNNGWAVGDSGKIYKSTDFGATWNQIGIGVTNKKLNSVSFPTQSAGWIMGQSGKILYTFNGGNSFSNQTTNDTIHDIHYLQMINSNTGYFCGSNVMETFGGTANAGINWIYSFGMNGNMLYSLSHITATTIVAVGTNGRIRRTTSNGTTWTIINSPVNAQLNHILFLDGNTGYIVGNSGNILKTTNSGLNWVVDAVPTSNNLRSVSFINTTTAWATGSNGVVVRTGIPVGLHQLGNEIPIGFKLEQNYPNPFNPVTTIKYSIPKNEFVEINIYNAMGRLVKKLVNSKINAGNYEAYFDASEFASGVYMYKLETSSYIESKKMILIK